MELVPTQILPQLHASGNLPAAVFFIYHLRFSSATRNEVRGSRCREIRMAGDCLIILASINEKRGARFTGPGGCIFQDGSHAFFIVVEG